MKLVRLLCGCSFYLKVIIVEPSFAPYSFRHRWSSFSLPSGYRQIVWGDDLLPVLRCHCPLRCVCGDYRQSNADSLVPWVSLKIWATTSVANVVTKRWFSAKAAALKWRSNKAFNCLDKCHYTSIFVNKAMMACRLSLLSHTVNWLLIIRRSPEKLRRRFIFQEKLSQARFLLLIAR